MKRTSKMRSKGRSKSKSKVRFISKRKSRKTKSRITKRSSRFAPSKTRKSPRKSQVRGGLTLQQIMEKHGLTFDKVKNGTFRTMNIPDDEKIALIDLQESIKMVTRQNPPNRLTLPQIQRTYNLSESDIVNDRFENLNLSPEERRILIDAQRLSIDLRLNRKLGHLLGGKKRK